MTLDQLASAVVLALLTAIFTSWANNFFEERRLNASWEREREERRDQYRRQRLEEQLKPVEAWARHVADLLDLVKDARRAVLPMDETYLTEDQREIVQQWREWGVDERMRQFQLESVNKLLSRALDATQMLEASIPIVMASVLTIRDDPLFNAVTDLKSKYVTFVLLLNDLRDRFLELPQSEHDPSSEKLRALQGALEGIERTSILLVASAASVSRIIDRILTTLEIVPPTSEGKT